MREHSTAQLKLADALFCLGTVSII